MEIQNPLHWLMKCEDCSSIVRIRRVEIERGIDPALPFPRALHITYLLYLYLTTSMT